WCTTDDLGHYRAYGLPGGRYLIRADGSEEGPGVVISRNSGKRFMRTFHPNTPDEKQATVVEVREGGEVDGIDINLGKKRTLYEVTGRVINSETGSPLSGGGVNCYLLGPDGYHAENLSIWSTIDSDGNFRLAGLPSGRYGLEAAAGKDYYAEETIVEV